MSKQMALLAALVIVAIAGMAVWAQLTDSAQTEPQLATAKPGPDQDAGPTPATPGETATVTQPNARDSEAAAPQSSQSEADTETGDDGPPPFGDAMMALQQFKATLPNMAFMGMVDTCQGLALENTDPDGTGAFAINDSPDGRSGPYPQMNVSGRIVTLCFTQADFAAFGAQEDELVADNRSMIDRLKSFVDDNFDDAEEAQLLAILSEAEESVSNRVGAREAAYEAFQSAR